MTFYNAAWAIDNATLRSALARVQAYAANSGAQGIVQSGDLKVGPLGTPGNGLTISAGSALVLNGYLGAGTDQMYTVSNPDVHTVSSGDMPSVSGSDQAYILAVVIGDAEFAQTGHPFMGPSDPPSGEEATFQYVRPVMISCGATATTLSVGYPAIPLARINIPSGVSTITSGMITDLRSLSRPRTQLEMGQATSDGAHNVTNTAWQRVPAASCVTVDIPSWAVRAKVVGFVEGLRLTKSGSNQVQIYVESDNRNGVSTNVNENLSGSDDRRSYNVGAVIDVRDLRGTSQKFSVRAQATNGGSSGSLVTDASTSAFLSVYFEEAPV